MMTSPRLGSQRDKPSMWSRARRERATPQGLNMMAALLLCFFCTMIGIILEGAFKLPESIVYPAVVIACIVILIVAVIRISAINRRAEEARREAYRQKFEKNLEAIKAWSERRSSGDRQEREDRES